MTILNPQELIDGETIQLGEFAEFTLGNELFHSLLQRFRLDAMDALLSTPTTDCAERERIYQTQASIAEFVGFLQRYVKAKDKLLGERKLVPFPVEGDNTSREKIEVELSDDEVFALVDEE